MVYFSELLMEVTKLQYAAKCHGNLFNLGIMTTVLCVCLYPGVFK